MWLFQKEEQWRRSSHLISFNFPSHLPRTLLSLWHQALDCPPCFIECIGKGSTQLTFFLQGLPTERKRLPFPLSRIINFTLWNSGLEAVPPSTGREWEPTVYKWWWGWPGEAIGVPASDGNTLINNPPHSRSLTRAYWWDCSRVVHALWLEERRQEQPHKVKQLDTFSSSTMERKRDRPIER